MGSLGKGGMGMEMKRAACIWLKLGSSCKASITNPIREKDHIAGTSVFMRDFMGL